MNSNMLQPNHQNAAASIAERALHLVSVEVSTFSKEEINSPSRKIAKKRRGQDGTCRIHRSKSDKEYLRKLQSSLQKSSSKEEAASNTSPSTDTIAVMSTVAPTSAVDGTDMSVRNNHQRGNLRRRTITNQSRGYSNVSTREKSLPSPPCDYEDPDKSSSNPYGYEVPDTVITPSGCRRVVLARRRGSVTKYSPQTAAAASLAMEQIKRLQLIQIRTPSSPLSQHNESESFKHQGTGPISKSDLSVLSIDRDSESLAPELESLCKISNPSRPTEHVDPNTQTCLYPDAKG